MKLSAIISTLGRTEDIFTVLNSLDSQDCRDFEVIVVDQNTDDRLKFLDDHIFSFPLERIHTPDQKGASLGRNVGLKRCNGEYVLFPDDDCWYPSDFLTSGLKLLESNHADGVTGRAANERGESINGRFLNSAALVDRKTAWITQIEWACIFKKDLLINLGGFDPLIGVGANSPWQSCEIQDLSLRALEKGAKIIYDPAFFGHHAELYEEVPSEGLIKKMRGYARGHGRVLKLHTYSIVDLAYWVMRPSVKCAFQLFTMRLKRAEMSLNIALGRFEGFFDRTPLTRHTRHANVIDGS